MADPGPVDARRRTTWRVGAALVVMAVLAALLLWRPWAGSVGEGGSEGSGPVGGSAPGAGALRGAGWDSVRVDPEEAFSRTGDYLPRTAAEAIEDQPGYYADDCHVEQEDTEILGCTYGAEDASTEVAVVGSSKAGVWVPALEEIGRREGWQVTVLTKSSCAFDPPVPTESYPECGDYNEAVLAELVADPPDLVFTSGQVTDGRELTAEDLSATWQQLLDAGTDHVVAFWDVPVPSRHVAECLEELPEGGDHDYVQECAYEQTDEAGGGILEDAVAQTDGALLVDVADWVCPSSSLDPRCPPVVGGVVVYGDGAHLTTTYATTLTDPVHQQLFELDVTDSAPAS